VPGELTADSRAERVMAVVQAAGPNTVDARAVAGAANIVIGAAQAALDQLAAAGSVVALNKPSAFVSRSAFDAAFDTLAAALRARHREKPWSAGMTASEAAAALAMDEPRAARYLAAWHDDGRLTQTGRLWRLPDTPPELTPAQRTFLSRALAEEPGSPLLPHSYDSIRREAASSGVPGMVEAIGSLLVTGGLVRIGDDLYRRAQMERARGLLLGLLQNGGSATMAQVRDAFGTSRKYALPLMEHFDSLGLTVRDGDLRRLRKVAHPAAT